MNERAKSVSRLLVEIVVVTLATLAMPAFSGRQVLSGATSEAPSPGPDLTGLHGSLAAYLQNGDPSYGWQLVGTRSLPGQGTLYSLALTSQTWQGITWRHRLQLFIPAAVGNREMALLYITGSGADPEELQYMSIVATATQAPVAILYDVPNQPLFGQLYEDALIAYTFKEFLETGDQTWPLLLPMTKSAVRAMDAIQEFADQKLHHLIKGFVVLGASKRGWTTWLTAAIDPRVKGIAPMVYNNLNLAEQMKLQLRSFGTFSSEIADYTELGLTQIAQSEEGAKLAAIVDPYSFREALTMPKLIIIGTNDPYWPADALNVYYDDLPGRNYILALPNAGHGLGDFEMILNTLSAFYLDVAGQLQLPEIRWQFKEENDSAELLVDPAPGIESVDFWIAASPSRDFRHAGWVQTASDNEAPFVQTIKRLPGMWIGVLGQVRVKAGDRTVILTTPVFLTGEES